MYAIKYFPKENDEIKSEKLTSRKRKHDNEGGETNDSTKRPHLEACKLKVST